MGTCFKYTAVEPELLNEGSSLPLSTVQYVTAALITKAYVVPTEFFLHCAKLSTWLNALWNSAAY